MNWSQGRAQFVGQETGTIIKSGREFTKFTPDGRRIPSSTFPFPAKSKPPIHRLGRCHFKHSAMNPSIPSHILGFKQHMAQTHHFHDVHILPSLSFPSPRCIYAWLGEITYLYSLTSLELLKFNNLDRFNLIWDTFMPVFWHCPCVSWWGFCVGVALSHLDTVLVLASI